MSKKLFAMLLALVMLLGVSNIALAEDPIELHFVCAYAANYGMQDLIDDYGRWPDRPPAGVRPGQD